MSIIDSLKKIDFLRRWVKECKTLREYMIDAYSFNKYYMEKCDKNRNYDYHMLMLVHNIEKGMCMPYLRPFGEEKILMLINMISAYEIKNQDKDASVYKMAVSIVFQWKLFYEKHGWSIKSYEIVSTFINNHADIEKLDVGYEIKKFEELKLDAPPSFESVLTTRMSVRDFEYRPLADDDVEYCVRMAQCAPTACNRQMIGIVQVSSRDKCDLISNTIYGSAGISKNSVTYFVVTYDINALDYYGERNQGYLNAGLVAMNFANALHSRGIGSCFLQWANTAAEDRIVRQKVGISEHERIAVVIASGYYVREEKIAKSCRRKVNEVYRKV